MKLRISQALIAIALSLLPAAADAQSYTIAPSPFLVAQDNSGHIISNACIWTYQTGTTTLATTYTDTAGTANLNPIRSDGAGRFTVYLVSGTSYKFVYESTCTPPAHGTTLRTADPVQGTPSSSASVDVIGTAGETISAGQVAYLSDGSGGKQTGQWFKADNANVYSSTQPELGLAISAITSGSQGTIRLGGGVTGLASLTIGGSYYVGTSGALTATAPANRRLIGVADTATSLVVLPTPAQSQLVPGTSTITTTGTQTALAIPSGSGPLVIYANNATLLTIQGITAGIDGQRLTIYAIGAGQVDTVHQSGGAAAALRLVNFATVGNTSGAAGSGVFDYIYNATVQRWLLSTHDQGGWLTPTFAAGNFTGNGAMTWTLAAGDFVMFKYWLKGRSLTVAFQLDTTTVGGTLNTTLQVSNTAWGGYSASSTGFFNALGVASDAGTAFLAYANTVSSSLIGFLKASGANWSAATDTTYIRGQITFEVS